MTRGEPLIAPFIFCRDFRMDDLRRVLEERSRKSAPRLEVFRLTEVHHVVVHGCPFYDPQVVAATLDHTVQLCCRRILSHG
ncbi:hypothetical protein AQ610_12565 [Burkholderia humptydooensis]|nr:hypothetical protein AQ610_12565 [Burkholderia humptydooensis]